MDVKKRKTYYCHDCAFSNRLVIPASPANLTAGSYQLSKYLRHTAPAGSQGIVSVFSDSTKYKEYWVNVTASGCLEIDELGRKNLVWFAGSKIGLTFRDGVYSASCEMVKVVLPESPSGVHLYPISIDEVGVRTCASCGAPVPF
jgi:hypothetical protein